MAVATFAARPPASAVDYLTSRSPDARFSFDWRDVWQQEHQTAFVVAKMMSRDLLTDVHGALIEAIKAGETRESFIKRLKPILQAKGWWGVEEATDPETGEVRKVRLGSSRRLGLIYDTNMRGAHAAARWERIQSAKAGLPYLVYTAVLDERTRLLHGQWGGRGGVRIILPVDHPFWLTHYPPNGWRCRCTVMQMSVAMLAARGWTVTTDEQLEALKATRTQLVPNRRRGTFDVVPVGIDPGFAYNVGVARRAALTPPPVPEPKREVVIGDRWPRALPPELDLRPLPAELSAQDEASPDQAAEAFAQGLGVQLGDLFTDRVQMPVVIGPELFAEKTADGAVVGSKAAKGDRHRWARALGAAVRDPDEIWIAFETTASGGVRLVRRYVVAFQDDDQVRRFTVTFADRDGWTGVTAFIPANQTDAKARRYIDKNVRAGTLVYRRTTRAGTA